MFADLRGEICTHLSRGGFEAASSASDARFRMSSTSRCATEPPELTAEEWEALGDAITNDDEFGSLHFHPSSVRGEVPRSAQLAYCRKLATLTANKPHRIDAIFRHSGLFTPRWEEARGDRTYGDLVIEEAIAENLGRIPAYAPEIVEGVFREGQLTALFGRYAAGKSPAVQQLALSVENGLPWFGRRVLRRKVFLLDFETPQPEFVRNMLRLRRRYAGEWKLPCAYLLLAQENCDGVIVLGNLSTWRWWERLEFIRNLLEQSPDALIIVDPVEHFLRFNRNRSWEVLRLFLQLRELLRSHPHAALLLVANLRRRGRRAVPSLLKDPFHWLEGIAGDLDLVNRCDVRLGFDFHEDPEIRVIHGVRRTEDITPILVRRVGTPGEWCGFERVELTTKSLELSLTERQREYWRRLPQHFRFAEIVAAGSVPKSSLSRLINATRSMGLLKFLNGEHQKV